MKDFLSFLIARDTMHQPQWLAVIEDMGGLNASLPIPNSFPQENEAQEHSYLPRRRSACRGHNLFRERFFHRTFLTQRGDILWRSPAASADKPCASV